MVGLQGFDDRADGLATARKREVGVARVVLAAIKMTATPPITTKSGALRTSMRTASISSGGAPAGMSSHVGDEVRHLLGSLKPLKRSSPKVLADRAHLVAPSVLLAVLRSLFPDLLVALGLHLVYSTSDVILRCRRER